METTKSVNTKRVSAPRRRFMQGVAATAALAGWPGQLLAQQRASTRFSRLFPQLPAFAEPSERLTFALLDMGKPGGLMDANDNLAAGAVALITDPALRVNNPDAAVPDGPAGTTFMGQFIDHDITFDTTSRLGVATQPRRAPNTRIPALDLDSLYGLGPAADPLLYDPRDRAKLAIASSGLFEDVPRLADGRAIIADPRNDEHVIIAGLQVAFASLHNRVVDRLRASREDATEVFEEARRLVTWHYQWIVVNEILPSFIGEAVVEDILAHGRRFYRPRDEATASIPVEFQGAAYRFGHSMVRPSYRANLAGDNGKAFFGMIVDPAGEGQTDPVDLRGGARAPRRFVGWQTFFDFGDGEVKPRKRIDTRISTPLFNLPLRAIASGDPPTSLPQRNLLRHLTWELPSGQRIAERMRMPSLTPRDLGELAGYGLGLERSTPLWYYILKEADLCERRPAPRPGGWTHRGRGADRPPRDRPRFVSLGRARLVTDASVGRWQSQLPDGGLAQVRRRGAGKPRPMIDIIRGIEGDRLCCCTHRGIRWLLAIDDERRRIRAGATPQASYQTHRRAGCPKTCCISCAHFARAASRSGPRRSSTRWPRSRRSGSRTERTFVRRSRPSSCRDTSISRCSIRRSSCSGAILACSKRSLPHCCRACREKSRGPAETEVAARLAQALLPRRAEAAREPPDDVELDAAFTWSAREVLHTKDFATMTAEELAGDATR